VFEPPSPNQRNVAAIERENTTNVRETALITNFDWSAEIAEVQEEINHALVAETSKMGENESAKINCEVEGCKKEENGIEKKENGSKNGGWSEKAEKECEEEKEEERKQNTRLQL